jgi:hypothetical protein
MLMQNKEMTDPIMLVGMLTFYEAGAAAGKSIETILLKYYQTFDFNTSYILQYKIKKLF